jgi:hypothetical protein
MQQGLRKLVEFLFQESGLGGVFCEHIGKQLFVPCSVYFLLAGHLLYIA